MAKKARKRVKPKSDVSEISAELQSLQHWRAWHLKSRIMIANRLRATVAGTVGYHSGMAEKERAKAMVEASKVIKETIARGEITSKMDGLILSTTLSIDGFDREKKTLEKEMLACARQLPVAAWVEEPNQRGFGLPFLGIVIGETGDLAGYANPGKVWRRLGCAPFTKEGETLMGATWRSRGKSRTQTKLHASDWEEFGYSPRRRSIAYLIGEGLIKQNNGGPYRLRYDRKKAEAARKHPDWLECSKCKGTGKTQRGTKCSNCKGTGRVMMRCHLHGMLLATKLLLKNLWLEWNDHPEHVKNW